MNRISSLMYRALVGPEMARRRARIAFGILAVTSVFLLVVPTAKPYRAFIIWVPSTAIVFAVLLVATAAIHDGKLMLASLKRWGAPLLSLTGAALLTIPAAVFPPRARRAWLGEVLESFAVRREHDTNWLLVLASYVRTWPADLLDEWLDYLKRRPNNLELTVTPGVVPLAPASGSYWKRHRTEIVWAIVFAVLFAPVAALAYEAVTETMHHSGQRWIWEAEQGH